MSDAERSVLKLLTIVATLADPVVEKVYPSSWTEVSPGAFVYNHTLTSQEPTTLSLVVGNVYKGLLQLNNIGLAESTSVVGSSSNQAASALINAPQEPQAGTEVSLQLNSTSVSFADLSAAGTGWGLTLKHPNGTETNLGLMQASSTVEETFGTMYLWVTQTPARLTQVGCAQRCGSFSMFGA
jgi:hypothetical protein